MEGGVRVYQKVEEFGTEEMEGVARDAEERARAYGTWKEGMRVIVRGSISVVTIIVGPQEEKEG